jgi:hypothetical protein
MEKAEPIIIEQAGMRMTVAHRHGHGDTSSELNAIARFKAMEGAQPAGQTEISFRQSQTVLRDLERHRWGKWNQSRVRSQRLSAGRVKGQSHPASVFEVA